MKPTLSKLVVGAFALAGSHLAAQDSVIVIGGAGSFGSNGSSNPGTLSDGFTFASARLVFDWDGMTSQLTLTVENNSPVFGGVPNPVLTDVFFNVPSGVTGLSLASQSGSGGATPSWTLSFDDDLGTNPNPNGADGFGAYNVMISTGGGVQGGISNPNADTLGVPAGTNVEGPATFVFNATGNLAGLTAFDFNSRLSQNPPGSQSFVGTAKFQSGGYAGASGFLSPSDSYCSTAAAAVDLGGGCGGSQISSELPLMGQACTIELKGAPPLACGYAYGSSPGVTPYTFKNCLIFLDPNPNSLFFLGAFLVEPGGGIACKVKTPSFQASPGCCGVSFILQGIVVDKAAPPGQRIGVTNGWQITLGS